jgi:hypothetical protein
MLIINEHEPPDDGESLVTIRNIPKICLALLVLLDFTVLIAIYVAAGFELGIIAFLRLSFLQYNFYESTSDVFLLALVRLLCLSPYAWHLLDQQENDNTNEPTTDASSQGGPKLSSASDTSPSGASALCSVTGAARTSVLLVQCGGLTFVLAKLAAIHYMDSVHSLVGRWLLSLVLCYCSLALIVAELALLVMVLYTEQEFERIIALRRLDEIGDKSGTTKRKKNKKQASAVSVRELLNSVFALWPYVWPPGEALMRLAIVVCVGLMMLGRVFNVLLPVAYKSLINALTNQTDANGAPHYTDFPTLFFFWYLAFYGLAKIMPDVRAFVFIYPQTYAQRKIQVETFEKLLNLGTFFILFFYFSFFHFVLCFCGLFFLLLSYSIGSLIRPYLARAAGDWEDAPHADEGTGRRRTAPGHTRIRLRARLP